MTLFRSSQLQLRGQQMSNRCGKCSLWGKSVSDQETKKTTTCRYLTGVLGLPGNFRGERTFGSKENFSLTFSSTDGATYVKPWGRVRGTKRRSSSKKKKKSKGEREREKEMWVHLFKDHLSKNNPQLMMSNEKLSKPYHAMWWNSERSFQENQQD